MRRRFILVIGILIFIAFIWLVTTVGIQSSFKKNERAVINHFSQNISIDNTVNLVL